MQKIAQKLIEKNPELVEIATNNTKSYKLLEAKVTTRLVAAIGRKEGKFIKRNELIWAIIDTAQGNDSGEELDY